jgi:hypothetical protein
MVVSNAAANTQVAVRHGIYASCGSLLLRRFLPGRTAVRDTAMINDDPADARFARCRV